MRFVALALRDVRRGPDHDDGAAGRPGTFERGHAVYLDPSNFAVAVLDAEFAHERLGIERIEGRRGGLAYPRAVLGQDPREDGRHVRIGIGYAEDVLKS